MKRRQLLLGLSAGVLGAYGARLFANRVDNSRALGEDDLESIRQGWQAYRSPDQSLPGPDTPLDISDDEWRERLSARAYDVLFDEATERPFTSPLNDEKRDGLYVCAACDLPLFTSAMKYDSGTGWPSFFTHIPHAMGTKQDFKLVLPRTEYHCIRCEGHQGHVFSDGPAPTGERWCNNGVALRFIPHELSS